MFVDRVDIHVKGGNGGNGCVSFYRAKYITHGGPDGGDGGKGGSIILKADESMATLMDFRYKKHFKAMPGQDGGKLNCSGKNAEDVVITVPVGTVVKERTTGRVMADMSAHGQQVVLIPGGRGGRGNQHFATPTRQAPRYAEPGKKAREYDVTLELKLIADVGIIGFPNVGKSTLLSMATNASPKIANYHFTTLSPNLGVVQSRWGESFVLADIPGLIEGAGQGAGLGFSFLRHIERTRVLIHMVDAAALEGGDPLEAIDKINAELAAYDPKLMELPQVIAANKTDIPEGMENVTAIRAAWEPKGVQVFALSAATGEGIDPLLEHVAKLLKESPVVHVVFEPDFDDALLIEEDDGPYTVHKSKPGYFVVEGPAVEKMLSLTNVSTESGFAFFQKYLKEKGIHDKLVALGIEDGDTVCLAGMEFEFFG